MSYLNKFFGVLRQDVVGAIFKKTDTTTVANTTTETSIVGNGIGTVTLPSNFFVVGKTIRIKGLGIHSSTANPTINIRIKLGSTVVATTGAVSSSTDTNAQFDLDCLITCRTTGASGTVMSSGHYEEDGTSPDTYQMVNTATTTIDTTASQVIAITVQWSAANANNTISLQNLVIESI